MPTGIARARRTAIDDDAFSVFLQRSLPAVQAFVRRLAGNVVDADDIVQETLAKVWRLRENFDPQGSGSGSNGVAWLQQAAFRTFCDHRKKQRRRNEVIATEVAEPLEPQRPCGSELRDELQHRLADLADVERDLLLGFHRDSLSLRELADLHNLPVNTVKSHLHRARQRLQRRNR